MTNITADGFGTELLNTIEEYRIDLSKCRGQGYDGANVMSGVSGGIKTHLVKF